MGRPRKHPPRFYRCIETFAGNDPETNEPYQAHKGEIWPDGPLLRKCKMFFVPLDKAEELQQEGR